MEFDFDLPEAVDETRECEVVKNGKCYGIFTVKHQFVGSPEWQIAYKRHNAKLSKRERERIDDPQTTEDVMLRRKLLIGFFVSNYVVSSRDVPRKDGEWKHSTANLIEYTAKTLVGVPGVSATYWRFDFTSPVHPSGHVEVSRIVMGERFEIGSGIDYEWTKGVVDDSVLTTGPNYEDVLEYTSRPKVKATFGGMEEAAFNELDAFMMRVGTKQPVLFAPEPDNLDSCQQWTVYGRVKVLFEGMNLYHNLWGSDIEVAGLKA